jgi:hypothetical protein
MAERIESALINPARSCVPDHDGAIANLYWTAVLPPPLVRQGNSIWCGHAVSVSPLAIRAFTPVFDALWRGSG